MCSSYFRFFLSLSLLSVFSSSIFAQDTVRVMHYNLLLYGASGSGCTPTPPATKNIFLSTILSATKPDVFTANEMGSNSLYADNIHVNVLQPINPTYKRTTYTNTVSSPIVNHLWYNSNKLEITHQQVIPYSLRDINYYKLYFKHSGLALGADTVFLHFVVVHYKAYSTAADTVAQIQQGKAIMDFYSSLGKPGNYFVCGDLNINASTDSSYKILTRNSDLNVRMYDPINAPGTWGGNSSFAAIHTQSPRASAGSDCGSGGGMDDRFDHVVFSEYVKNDSAGVRYIPSTYKAYGNDGQHYNNSLNAAPTNTAVSTSVANALVGASDHLPIILDLEVSSFPVSVQNPHFKPYALELEGNPVDNQAFIKITRPVSQMQNLSIRILDISGKTIDNQQFMIYEANERLTLPTHHLSSGFYILEADFGDGNTLSKKLIKW